MADTPQNRAMSFLAQQRVSLGPGPYHEPDAAGRPAPDEPAVRLIAFYLPQFHPIPENDRWWGAGFTEWTNVTCALPQFAGHYQPHLPGALGFYDLRMPETLRAQATLARRYGLHGFCFHYYWFGGHKLLETPLNLLLANPDIDLPFCLCWANENWTRRWDGLEDEVLIAQHYSREDDLDFIRSIGTALRDPRYIRIGGRPLILLYRPAILPNALSTARRWRVYCAEVGLGNPYLAMVQCFGDEDPRPYGFDAAVEFPPHKIGFTAPRINAELRFFDPASGTAVSEYEEMRRRAAAMPIPSYTLFRGVCPSWDNEARKPGAGHVFAHATPSKYEAWLRQACEAALVAPDSDERLVFINAWNEWAEGAHLEPDRHFGHAYLNATARVLKALPIPHDAAPGRRRLVVVSHDAWPMGAQYNALSMVKELVRTGTQVHVLLGGPGPLENDFAAVAPTERIESEYTDPVPWRAIGARLRAQGFTAVLCNTTVSAQAIPPLRRAGLRIVSMIHELPSFIRERRLEEAARTVAREADVVVFASTIVRDGFTAISGPIAHRTVIRPQGLYVAPAPLPDRARLRRAARAALGTGPADRILLGCGHGDARKGMDLWPSLIRAACTAYPDALFVWVGSVEAKTKSGIVGELEAAGLLHRLRLTGHVEDVRPYYCAADLLLLTSREDPFPSVVLEAMAHGVPVIGFEGSGGIASVVSDAGGPLVPMGDTEAMVREACRLLRDESARRVLAEAAERRLQHGFSFAEYMTELQDLALGPARSVSVIVPNYNYARYLRQRVTSILAQTYPVHEIILLDDASTDDSAVVIAELEREYPSLLRVVRNGTNCGSVARQWARGVALAEGELVWIAEADDFADPGFLAAVVPAFDHPGTVLSYCESRQVDEAGIVHASDYLGYLADVDPARWRRDYRRRGVDEIAQALSVKNTIPNVSAVVFRRDALVRVLQAHLEELASLRNAADWCCYMRLLTDGDIAFTPKPLNNHRRHQRGVTIANNDRRHLREIAAMQRLAASLVRVPPIRQEAAERWRDQVAAQFGFEQDASGEAGPVSQQSCMASVRPRLNGQPSG